MVIFLNLKCNFNIEINVRILLNVIGTIILKEIIPCWNSFFVAWVRAISHIPYVGITPMSIFNMALYVAVSLK